MEVKRISGDVSGVESRTTPIVTPAVYLRDSRASGPPDRDYRARAERHRPSDPREAVRALAVHGLGCADIARLLGPTGGYLLAFPVASFAVGMLAGARPTFIRLVLSMAAALLIVFTCGTLQLRLVYSPDWASAFTNGFMIFSWWDLVKLAGAASIARAIVRARR